MWLVSSHFNFSNKFSTRHPGPWEMEPPPEDQLWDDGHNRLTQLWHILLMLPQLLMTNIEEASAGQWLETGPDPKMLEDEWGTGHPLPGLVTSFWTAGGGAYSHPTLSGSWRRCGQGCSSRIQHICYKAEEEENSCQRSTEMSWSRKTFFTKFTATKI